MWLLPSGPDQVGEALARANLSGSDIGNGRRKHNPSERQTDQQKALIVFSDDVRVIFFKLGNVGLCLRTGS